MIAWHYTTCVQLEEILQSGKLIPTGAHREPGERPALWFSMNQVWETTATKEVKLDGGVRYLNSMAKVHKVLGIIRIGVNPVKVRLLGFASFARKSGISKAGAASLRDTGREVGADVYEWRVSFEPIPAEQWAAIEVRTGERWEPLSRSEAAKAVRRVSAAQTSGPLFARTKP